jgi:predicted nucleotidyltransferase
VARRDPPASLRGAVDAIVAACRSAFGPHLKCVILKGSAVKGDFVPDYSDLDLHAFVDGEILLSDRTPKLEYALRFQEAIGALDPRAVGASQFQVYFLRADRTPEDWNPSVPGSYEVVYGEPPHALHEWKAFDYVAHAKRNLARISDDRRMLIDRIVDKPNRALATYVRLAGTYLKGHAYSAAIVASGDPVRALGMHTTELVAYLKGLDPSLSAVRRFFDLVAPWEGVERDPPHARAAFRQAIEALEAIERWAASGPVKSPPN